MSFLDIFWVPLDYRIPREYLVVISSFEALLIITLYIVYQRIKSDIKKSLLGPAKDVELKFQLIVIESIRSIFIGSILIVLSNLVSHISGFFDSYCPFINQQNYVSCYLFIGQEDIIQFFGLAFLVIGTFNLNAEIVRPEDQKAIKFKVYPSLFAILTILLVSTAIYQENNLVQLLIELAFMYTIFVLVYVVLLVKILRSTLRKFNSPLINIRKIMVFILYLSIMVGNTTIEILFILRNGFHQARTINVEYYFMSFNIFSILMVSQIYLIVRLPNFILNWNGLDLKDKLKYADYRFDNPIAISSELIILHEKSNNYQPANYLLTYDKDEALLCKMLLDYYESYSIGITQLNEETLVNIHLPNVDILFFVSRYSKIANKYFRDIQLNYFLSYYYDYEINCVNSASHKFISDTHEYALLTIGPSIWNIQRKIVIINFPPKLTNVIFEFFRDFKEYIGDLFVQYSVVQIVIRFPIINDRISTIPAVSPLINYPDQKYIEILV